VGAPMIAPEAIEASPLLSRAQALRLAPWRALAGGAAMAALALGWVALADRIEAPMPRHVALPQVAGWHRVDYAPHVWWQPRAGGADHRLLGRYADGRGHAVDVFYALYAAQGPGRKAGGFGEGALTPGTGWAWQSPGPAAPDAKSDRLLAGGPTERLAQTTYRTGDLLTGSNLALKLANIRDRLLLRRRSTMVLILSAEEAPGHPAAASVEAFRAGVGPLGGWMDAIAKGA